MYSSECDDLIQNIEKPKAGKQLTTEGEKQDLSAYICHTKYGFNLEIIDLFYRISSNLNLHYFDRFSAATNKYAYLNRLSKKYKKDSYNQVKNMIDERFVINDLILRVKEKLKNKDASSKAIYLPFKHKDISENQFFLQILSSLKQASSTDSSSSLSNERVEELVSPIASPQAEEDQPKNTAIEANSSETTSSNALDPVSSNDASTANSITLLLRFIFK